MKIFFSNIYEDVLHFQEKDHSFMMVGDFNARTSNKPDFVYDSGNKYLTIGQLNNTIEITQRNNFDGEVNKHGNKLIGFCRSTNLKIVNGRKSGDSLGDSLGRFNLFYNNNGASTVDYCLSDDKIFPLIKKLHRSKTNFSQWSLSNCIMVGARLMLKVLMCGLSSYLVLNGIRTLKQNSNKF